MTELRQLRRQADWTQMEFAARLGVPLNSLRMWDSGLRQPPFTALVRAREIVADQVRQTELLSLPLLAAELGVHKSTLEAAARTGRLRVTFSSRSAFGRPIRFATRADGHRFREDCYGRRSQSCCAPLPDVPDDYDRQLKDLRGRLELTQAAFAGFIGAAGKAVVYQWESRKRVPSPVFWKRVQALQTRSSAS